MNKENIIGLLIRSKQRRKILLYLLSGKKSLVEIKNYLCIKSSFLMIQLKLLLKKKIIFENKSYYELTKYGFLLVNEMNNILLYIETIESQYNYWS